MSEQSKAAVHRRADAAALLETARWRGAMYLAGYALECTLKAKLMRRHGCQNLDELEQRLIGLGLIGPDDSIYNHRIELYLRLSGALDRLRNDGAVWSRFQTANGWLPSWRYNPDLACQEDAEDFVNAIDGVLAWVNANV